MATTGGNANAHDIWRKTDINRQDVYRVLAELQQKGLIAKLITKPTLYQAISLKEGLTIMLKNRKNEILETEKLLKQYQGNQEKHISNEEGEFIVYPTKEYWINTQFRNLAKAQTSIYSVCSLERYATTLYQYCKQIEDGLAGGVQFHTITSYPEKKLPDIVKYFMKKQNYKLKFLQISFNANFGIIDKMGLWIFTSKPNAAADKSVLWSNNPALAEIMNNYFEHLWNIALELKTELTLNKQLEY